MLKRYEPTSGSALCIENAKGSVCLASDVEELERVTEQLANFLQAVLPMVDNPSKMLWSERKLIKDSLAAYNALKAHHAVKAGE